MQELILHHYPQSPFAEKARMMLGFKNLPWRSVIIPAIMPKPDLTALTGGYRRTPVLQIGADIYCDTALIARRLDRLQSLPALFPEGQEAVAASAAQFADQVLFQHAVAINFQPQGLAERFKDMPDAAKTAFAADRKALFTGGSASRLPSHQALSQWPSLLGRLEQQLSESGSFLLGEEPSIVDFAYYHPLWFVASNSAVANALDPYPQVLEWMNAVASCGHGDSTTLDASAAIQIARDATPESVAVLQDSQKLPFTDPEGLTAGQTVTISATDYGTEPVTGTLVYQDAEEIVISREDDRAGEVHVHFPRFGFSIQPAG
ncbi:MAG: glutathione S-transferase [Alteromonadaceae bacterium]|nr:glutathione S-transferase [Alteromonadaceae bacterium]|tara:strand:- start:392 stop:1348 length:957 start_codon:yes stop_codon:yes gene_type:complete